MRVGIGYDAHALVKGRPLILGGVTLESPVGLAGHSDADVLSHAIADAVLGAAALGDIGDHFPSGDPRWEGVSSLGLLEAVSGMIGAVGLCVGSVDATVLLESPKIAPHRAAMCKNIAAALGVSVESVSVKATTTDGLGLVGRGEGAVAQAVAVLVARI